MDPELRDILKDFPRGPLCLYRKKASFNWKDMAVLMQGKDALILKVFTIILYYLKISHSAFKVIIYLLAQNMDHS